VNTLHQFDSNLLFNNLLRKEMSCQKTELEKNYFDKLKMAKELIRSEEAERRKRKGRV
jgi:hypothetical protein